MKHENGAEPETEQSNYADSHPALRQVAQTENDGRDRDGRDAAGDA